MARKASRPPAAKAPAKKADRAATANRTQTSRSAAKGTISPKKKQSARRKPPLPTRLTEAAPEAVGISSARLARVSALVQGYVDDGKIPGAITVVGREDRVVHFETHGVMDAEAGTRMRPDTIFRIYSMTKPIASVALMMLYEEGRFQLDDPVARFIPSFTELKVYDGGSAEDYRVRDPSRAMSVRDVLMHTSGLVSADNTVVGQIYRRADLRPMRGSGSLAEMVAALATVPLACDPGSEWNYGISTDVVGHLVELISGESFDQFLEQRIFRPLGMVDTGFHVPAEKASRFAACYRRASGNAPGYVLQDNPKDSGYLKPKTYFSGAGGLVSTAADYIRFCKLLTNGGSLDGVSILGPRTLEYMTVNHLPNNCDMAAMGQPRFTETTMEGIGFGLGFAVLLDPTVAQVIGTPGEYYWGGAASTAFFVSPAEDLFMIFMTQLLPSGTYPFRRELRQTIYQSLID
jgi:CubicO group peptidase (beta-lactamase class C family)